MKTLVTPKGVSYLIDADQNSTTLLLWAHRLAFKQGVHQVVDDLLGYCNLVIGVLLNETRRLEVERIAQDEKTIAQLAKEDHQAQRLMQLSGIGPTGVDQFLLRGMGTVQLWLHPIPGADLQARMPLLAHVAYPRR